MELVRFSLCTECEYCPEVNIEADRVTIGEDDNLVTLRTLSGTSLLR